MTTALGQTMLATLHREYFLSHKNVLGYVREPTGFSMSFEATHTRKVFNNPLKKELLVFVVGFFFLKKMNKSSSGELNIISINKVDLWRTAEAFYMG